ncbi:hypothetical protein SAMN05421640_1449 [Ekhidna lutea]|uniref:Uncharacterized protein n=1 Tax=Ekhidna lutea TaxID=447679 RepID=A0A239HQV2_EKHLU|nr:tetratricopeptide repeat protein [Ekhidna lutea]SNS83666.1 hypothetical protein SAMN05421640_1449 [Ekhidna lutea]
MRIISTVLILLSFFGTSSAADKVEESISSIIEIMKSHTDSAITLSHKLLDEAKSDNHEYGIVQSNFILGYIHDKLQVDYGKAIVYYLEAIRYAEDSSYPDVQKNLISLYKNCGVIYRKFKAFDLSIEYYQKGLDLAKYVDNHKQIISISYNMAGLFNEMRNDEMAIKLLNQVSELVSPEHPYFFDINNRLSQIYLDNKKYSEAYVLALKILNQGSPSQKELIDTYQILGRVELSAKNFTNADKWFNRAIDTAKTINDRFYKEKALFETFVDKGNLYTAQENTNAALAFYHHAEDLIPQLDQKPQTFSVLKLIANLYFDEGNYNVSKKYEDLYSANLNNYLNLQEEIQSIDKRYNMDLITKRYFDEVAKQEKIASILFYSRLISGSLLALLLFTIGFNWYQKVRLRRSIIKDLVDLQVLK